MEKEEQFLSELADLLKRYNVGLSINDSYGSDGQFTGRELSFYGPGIDVQLDNDFNTLMFQYKVKNAQARHN